MKNILYLVICTLPLTPYCEAMSATNNKQSVQYLELKTTGHVESGNACKTANFTADLMNNVVRIHSSKGDLDVKNELEGDNPTLIAGDFWGNGHCFLALMTAKSEVNESYDIYEISPSAPPKKVVSAPDIINPDFKDGVVTSSYRDAARWHKEKLCYPTDKNPYLCEKYDYISETAELAKRCTPSGTCNSIGVVKSNSGTPAKAIVIKEKLSILMPDPSGKMKPQKSYLIQGDALDLLDYRDTDDGSYFQFEYKGKKKTVGWVDASSVKII